MMRSLQQANAFQWHLLSERVPSSKVAWLTVGQKSLLQHRVSACILCLTRYAAHIVLLGICLTPDQARDSMGELLVQQPPLYACISSNIPMRQYTSLCRLSC